jgi:hypothetical protein
MKLGGALAGAIVTAMLSQSGPASLDVVLEKSTIKSGEPVSMYVKYTNLSQTTIILEGAGGEDGFTPLFRIKDGANRVVCEGGQRLKGGIFSMTPVRLGPGEAATRGVALNKWCDTTGLSGKYTIEIRSLDFNNPNLNGYGIAQVKVEPPDVDVTSQHVQEIYEKIAKSGKDAELRTLVSELAYSGSPTAVKMVSELVLPSGRHYLDDPHTREDAVLGLATIRTEQSVELLAKIALVPHLKVAASDALHRMYADIVVAKKPAESGNVPKRLEQLLRTLTPSLKAPNNSR